MIQDFKEAAVEINAIFDNMSSEILNKIPLKIRTFFKENASKTYKFVYDKTKTLDEQNIQDKTRGIIALLYRDYLCEENEKIEYNKRYYEYLNKKEEEKRKLYNPDTIFENKIKENDNGEKYPLIVIEEEKNIIKRFFTKILNFFR